MLTMSRMRRSVASVLAAVLVIALAGASACSVSEYGTKSQVVEIVRNNVLMRISTDERVYQPGQRVSVTVYVENLSSSPVQFTMWNIGDPAIYIGLQTNPYSTGQMLHEEGRYSAGVLPAITGGVLEPRQSITRSVVWDQQLFTHPDHIQAPSGKYTIQAAFFVGKYSSENEPLPLTGSIDIEVEGVEEILTPEKALGIALETPKVQEWYQEHSGANLVKQEDGNYHVWFSPGWMTVHPSITLEGLSIEQFKNKYIPESNVSMVQGVWEVRLFTKFGPSPHEIRVKVDPATGEVLD